MLLGFLLARSAQPVAAWDLPSPETSPALLRTMSEAELAQGDLVLEEYIQLLRDHPADKPLTFSCDGTEYTVYLCPGLQVTVPESGDYTISGNNADGFIVTVTGA